MTRVLVATDKFKGSCDATQVGASVAAGIRGRCDEVSLDTCPVADGGDGTVAAAVAAGYTRVPVLACGPTGEPVWTSYARSGRLAVVELADVSGLQRLPGGKPAPMAATSRGTGEVIAAAIGAGCTSIVLGVGGSACTDGGAGMLQALGARLLDTQGVDLPDGGSALARLVEIDTAALREQLHGVDVVVACDVDNPLTGPSGAAAVYAPQKGADATQVQQLAAGLRRLADLVADVTGVEHRQAPGSGAAGGVGFAAIALLGARFRSGIDLVLELVGFHERLCGTQLVVTGEGSLDVQTLRGKAPAGVAAAAVRRGLPVVAVCGHNTLTAEQLRNAGIVTAYPLSELEPDTQRSMVDAAVLLERIGENIAREHL